MRKFMFALALVACMAFGMSVKEAGANSFLAVKSVPECGEQSVAVEVGGFWSPAVTGDILGDDEKPSKYGFTGGMAGGVYGFCVGGAVVHVPGAIEYDDDMDPVKYDHTTSFAGGATIPLGEYTFLRTGVGYTLNSPEGHPEWTVGGTLRFGF